MKKLPDEKELIELLAMAKTAEEKAKRLYEMATIMALKCELRAEKRLSVMQKPENGSSGIMG